MRPDIAHSSALSIPTMRGRNQLEQASGTMPRFAKTKPYLAFLDASLTSMAHCIVAPIPTAGPLHAEMTGFKHSKILRVSNPPPSGFKPVPSFSALKAPLPLERSAPAQKPLPAPVIMMAFTSSSASARSNASMSSVIIVPVKALSFSGRFSVIVRIPSSSMSKRICS